MNTLKILIQNEVLIFRNSHLKTIKQKIVEVGLPILLLVLGLTTWIYRVVYALLAELGMNIISMLFGVIFAMFLFSSLVSIQRYAQHRLLTQPELSFLITSPISAGTLFLFRIFLLVLNAREVWYFLFFLILPIFVTVGIAAGAPWFYYLFVLPVICSLLIIAASFAVVSILLLARVLSPKQIAQATAVLGFLGTALWIGFFFWGIGEIEPLLLEWARAKELLRNIIVPITDAAIVLTGLIHGEFSLWSLTRLFVVTGMFLGGSMLIARKVYYKAYERSQIVEISVRKQVKLPAREPLSLGRRSNVILIQWKMATRNYDMALGGIAMLGGLGVYLFYAIGFILPEPWDNLLYLAHIGAIGLATSLAVEIFFITVLVVWNSKERKEQFSVLKSAPFSGRDFIIFHWLAPFILQILLSGVILVVFHIFLRSSIPTILLSLVILACFLCLSSALQSVLDMAAMGGKGRLSLVAGYNESSFLPVVYSVLALGILALGLVYTEIWFLSFLHHMPHVLVLTISGAIFLTLTGFTLYHSLRLVARDWEEMEL